ncbi:MAG: hypothetical protein IKA39_05060 [Clostridia bacterium]|nr:hypothetical protein [Clostridia bacterium]MBR2874583.1 hypothetical protein [Clostridia bacterium]
MANDLFKIFGLDSTCTEEELDNKYNELKAKYREDMFLEGRDGDIAAKKLTELENAYYDIKTEMSYKAESEKEDKDSYTSDDFIYEKIEKLVKEGALNEAQVLLDDIMTRNGKWHYYQAMIFYKKDWFTDSKKQLLMALDEEPDNQRYKTALERLDNLMSGNDKQKNQKAQKTTQSAEEWWKENSHNENGEPDWDANKRQMGGCADTMDCCTQLLCMNLMCNCLGGGC